MNQHFNITRFTKLFKKEFSERISTIITISAIFSIILMIWWLITFLLHLTGDYTSAGSNSRAGYLLGVFIFSVISSPLILYSKTNHRKKGVDYITLPASFNEKFVSMLINSLIVFPILVGATVITADLIISTLSPAIFNGSILFSGSLGNIWNFRLIDTGWSIFSLFTLFLLCNAIYRRSKTVKTIFSILLFYLMVSIIIGVLVQILFHQQTDFTLGGPNILALKESIKPFEITVKVLLVYLLPIAAITGSYFKMKNQQY